MESSESLTIKNPSQLQTAVNNYFISANGAEGKKLQCESLVNQIRLRPCQLHEEFTTDSENCIQFQENCEIITTKLVRFSSKPIISKGCKYPFDGELEFSAFVQLVISGKKIILQLTLTLTDSLEIKLNSETDDSHCNTNTKHSIHNKIGSLKVSFLPEPGPDPASQYSDTLILQLIFADDQGQLLRSFSTGHLISPSKSIRNNDFESTSTSSSSTFTDEEFLTTKQCCFLIQNCLVLRRRKASKILIKNCNNSIYTHVFVIQAQLKLRLRVNNDFICAIQGTDPIINQSLIYDNDNDNHCYSYSSRQSYSMTSALFDRISNAKYNYPFRLIYSNEIRKHWDFWKSHLEANLLSSKNIEEETRAQSKSELWRKKRLLLITTSKFKSFAVLQETADAYEFHQEVQSILPKSIRDPCYIDCNSNYFDKNHADSNVDFDFDPVVGSQHGRIYERQAINLFLKQYAKVITDHCEVGLCIQPKLPYLGTSPDYLVAINGVLHIVEVKCPYRLYAKGQTILEAVRLGDGQFLVEEYVDDGENKDGDEKVQLQCQKSKKIRVNPKNKVYYQMQGQLNLCNVDHGILIVFAPPEDLLVVFVEKDVTFFNRLLRKLTRIWFTRILPHLDKANLMGSTTTTI